MKFPFHGELMACAICGKEEQHDPTKPSSNWRFLELDGYGFYLCPSELPGDLATAQEFKVAYLSILVKLIEKIKQYRSRN